MEWGLYLGKVLQISYGAFKEMNNHDFKEDWSNDYLNKPSYINIALYQQVKEILLTTEHYENNSQKNSSIHLNFLFQS